MGDLESLKKMELSKIWLHESLYSKFIKYNFDDKIHFANMTNFDQFGEIESSKNTTNIETFL